MTLRDIKIKARKEYNKPKNRGDFDIYFICKNEYAMIIPIALYHIVVLDCNATNAQTVMEYISSRPQAVARCLGWTEEEVMTAFKKLAAQAHAALNSPKQKNPPRTKE
jgi:hypothetical protein